MIATYRKAMSENIFATEWMDCLEAHYTHVIRTKDHVTEPSLTIVMHSAGFTDKQLAELRVRATMHVDDVGADFVPDLDVLNGHDHDAHPHDHAGEEAIEPAVFNIPIDLRADGGAAEAVPAPSNADASQADVEAELDSEGEMGTEELEVELDVSEAELEAEVAADEEPIELEAQEPDPDAPQQLSLF